MLLSIIDRGLLAANYHADLASKRRGARSSAKGRDGRGPGQG